SFREFGRTNGSPVAEGSRARSPWLHPHGLSADGTPAKGLSDTWPSAAASLSLRCGSRKISRGALVVFRFCARIRRRLNRKGRDEGPPDVRDDIEELDLGELARDLDRRECRVVDPDAPEVAQLHRQEVAQHRADNIAVGDEQYALPLGFAERAHNSLDAARLDLADTFA